jgi:hypothetical protein
MAKSC